MRANYIIKYDSDQAESLSDYIIHDEDNYFGCGDHFYTSASLNSDELEYVQDNSIGVKPGKNPGGSPNG